ncbi:MAG: GNAT family N-acetyltransferase [Odoribacter sp.]|nr:GNAT family N-acetyltransferase [Odoribacter sp.]
MNTSNKHRFHIFEKASEKDFKKIWKIIDDARNRMICEDKKQWDKNYPSPSDIHNDIIKETAYVLKDVSGQIECFGAVIFEPEPAYKTIEGEWLSKKRYVVVHRLAVSQKTQGQGIATYFMQQVETLALEKGIESFKVDTNFDNFAMMAVLDKLGFTYCGEISYEKGKRRAYEKRLKS